MMLKHKDAKMRELSADGMNYKDVAKVLGYAPATVRKYMSDKGISINANTPKKRKKNTNMSFRQAERHLNKRLKKHFRAWMCGQTVPEVRGEPGVYRHDVDRYAEGVFKGVPTYFD